MGMEQAEGSKSTFVVQVQFCRNASWQGTVAWTEKKKEQSFRSALELIKLIDEALAAEQKKGSALNSWE